MWIFYDMYLYIRREPGQQKRDIDNIEFIDEKIATPIVYFIAGGIGGFFSTIIGQPMDTVKTCLQTMPVRYPPIYTGTFDCFRQIISKQGVRGLYNGLGVALLSIPPAYAVSFYGFGLGKYIQEVAGFTDRTAMKDFIAGGISGTLTSLIISPSERIKVLVQVHNTHNSELKLKNHTGSGSKKISSLSIISKLYEQGGIKSLYKGTWITLMRDIPGYAVFFSTYELLKSHISNVENISVKAQTIFIGGLAGIMYWLAALPSDNVKNKMQSTSEPKHDKGTREIFMEIYKKKGIVSLYTGLTVVILRAFPANAACFLAFEYSLEAYSYFFK